MSFQQGRSGLNAAAKNLDAIGNNVANANTVGFKSSGLIFADVFAASIGATAGNSIGIGTTVASVQTSFTQGNIRTTSNPLDMAINGNGFFRVDVNGAVSYTRNGQFHLDANGFIVSATGAKLTGYGVDAQGNILIANPSPLQISSAQLAATATTAGQIGLNLDAREPVVTVTPFNIANSATYNKATSLTIYDSLGNAHALSTYYVKTAANTWDVYAAVDGVALPASIGTLNFNTNGTLNTTTTTLPFNLALPIGGGAVTPLTMTLDFTNSTQYGSGFSVDTLEQDGFAAGQLAGYGIDDAGVVIGRYSNGQTRAMGQLVLASFKNPHGLQPLREREHLRGAR
ncbi:MAG: flagellar hook protein FlgE, partial [Burkholderiales bacterium]|nr:flagellar hook protein FlgE [Burkholderiales bacterium]